MFPVAHLTLHSRMSGSRWMITPPWCPGSLTSFLYSSFVYSCYLVLLSSTSFRSITVFCLFVCLFYFIVHIIAWNIPPVSLIFLKRSLVFPILLFSSVAFRCSLKKVSHLSLLFFGTLTSGGYVFPFLLSLSPASFFTPRPNFPVTPSISWPPNFAFQSPMMNRSPFFVHMCVGSRRSCRSS